MDLKAKLASDTDTVILALQNCVKGITQRNLSDEYLALLFGLREYYVTHKSTMYDLSTLENQECANLIIVLLKGIL